jgi:hypothetical protein
VFMVIGFYLNRVEPNWFVGIRTPWTLTSERSWRKTHELGRWVFLLMGLALMISSFLRTAAGSRADPGPHRRRDDCAVRLLIPCLACGPRRQELI